MWSGCAIIVLYLLGLIFLRSFLLFALAVFLIGWSMNGVFCMLLGHVWWWCGRVAKGKMFSVLFSHVKGNMNKHVQKCSSNVGQNNVLLPLRARGYRLSPAFGLWYPFHPNSLTRRISVNILFNHTSTSLTTRTILVDCDDLLTGKRLDTIIYTRLP